jgi:hypothetical protein
MLIAFQVVLILMLLLSGLFVVAGTGKESPDDRNRNLALSLASIIALTITYFIN